MEEIKRQVSRARRRMITEQFLSVATWSLFAALLISVLAIAIPKIWVVSFAGDTWTWSWLGGGLGAGFLLACVWTYYVRRSAMEAAVEIDRRFGLKERVSSTLSLEPRDLESEAGQALMSDAARRVARVNVGEQFGVKMNWRTLLPLGPALAAGLLFLAPDAQKPAAASGSTTAAAARQQVKVAAENAKKALQERQKRAAESGLTELNDMMKELERVYDELSKKDVDRKPAMVKLNDLAKTLEKRRGDLGDKDALKEQLSKLKDLAPGPADKMAEALKTGDFQNAVKEMQKLKEKLEKGELSEADQKKLAEQLKQVQEKMQKLAEAHEQAKQDLQQQIQEAKQQGDLAKAGKLQQKLDKLNAQNKQMENMQQMAQQLAKAQQQLQKGDQKAAAQELQKMAQQMQQMEQQLQEMEGLEQMMQEVADAKNSMNCKECGGKGCEKCQGDKSGMSEMNDMSMGMSMSQEPGEGLGEGQGRGRRPEEETATNTIESRVKADPKKGGETVLTGEAEGQNKSGQSHAAAREAVEASLKESQDPLVTTKLPRQERDHTRQYFEKIRKGQ